MQTITEHDNFNFLQENLYLQLYKKEIEQRIALNYPPVGILIECILMNKNKVIVQQEAIAITTFLTQCIESNQYTIQILGPTEPLIEKIKKNHHQLIYCKAKYEHEIENTMHKLQLQIPLYKSKIYINRH